MVLLKIYFPNFLYANCTMLEEKVEQLNTLQMNYDAKKSFRNNVNTNIIIIWIKSIFTLIKVVVIILLSINKLLFYCLPVNLKYSMLWYIFTTISCANV